MTKKDSQGSALRRRGVMAGVLGGLVAMMVSNGCSAPRDTEGESSSGNLQWNPPAGWFKERLTGADMPSMSRWHVGGTDLGIPYLLENQTSVGFLFGDTFDAPGAGGPGWRSPVMLRSPSNPANGIVFDSAAKILGDGFAPEIMYNQHNVSGNDEWSVIPNDGISFPETGRQVVSFMSVRDWDGSRHDGAWATNYASLAYSDNGNDFTRAPYLGWGNDSGNHDPFQTWTMQRDGDFVYVFSVRAGRQNGPMMLQRVRWQNILDKGAYEGWGYDGQTWGWGRPATPILNGNFGEPSVRKMPNGTWAMSYLTNGMIVTRTASGPDAVWSDEKIQVTSLQEACLYGGFIHPWSDLGTNNLHMMVSTYQDSGGGCGGNGQTAYDVRHWVGTL